MRASGDTGLGRTIGRWGTQWRETAIAGALVTAVWAIALSRWIVDDFTVPWDAKNQFYAFFRFLAESLRAGTTVFWNPYHFGGHPSIADPQSLIFQPAFLAWALIDPQPTMLTFDVIVFAHLLAGALGIVGIGHRHGWPAAASAAAAAVFMLGGPAAARLNHTGIIVCYGLLPCALLALDIALERRTWIAGIAFAVIASVIVLGRNQVALMLCLLIAAAGARHILSADRRWLWLRSRGALLATIGGITTTLTAVPLLLTLQLAALSNRPAASLAEALDSSMHLASLASLVSANVFGAHVANFGYWGPNYVTVPAVAATDESFNYMFVGAVPVMCVMVLGLGCGWLLRAGPRFWALVLAAALAFSFGRYTPLYPWVFEHVPGFAYFRRPIDGIFVANIAVAMLTGGLLAAYSRGGSLTVRPGAAVAATIAMAGVIAAAVTVASVTDHAWQTLGEIGSALAIVTAGGGILWAAAALQRRMLATAVVSMLAVAQLVAWNAACRLNAEARSYYRVLEQASAEDVEALEVLAQAIELRHREGARPRVEIIGLGGAWQNLAMVQHLEVTNGYNPLRIGIYDRYVTPGEANATSNTRKFPATFSSYDCALARALGLEYLVLDRPLETLEGLRHVPKAETLFAGPKIWIYRLAGAQPRVKFTTNVEITDLDATTVSGALRHEPRLERAVIDDDTPPRHILPASLTASPPGNRPRIASWKPGRIEIDVDTAVAGVVVLNDIYYPGWIAEIDGEAVPVLRADVLFRAVEVPAGRHRVVFRFAPLSMQNLGAAIASLRPAQRGPSDDPLSDR